MAEISGAAGLAERVAVVTGGGGGIGLATATALAMEGASVVLVDLDERTLDRAAEQVSAHGAEAMALRLDCRDESDMARMAEETISRFGSIDVLVAAAGILRRGAPKPIAQMSVADWDDVVDTNLRGVFLTNRAVLPSMIGQRDGRIVNVASLAAREPRALDAAYSASKAGVVALSQAVAEEVRRYGVRVNAVLPGAVETGLWKQNGPIPAPDEMLPPRRVAELILFLLALPPDAALVDPVIVPFTAGRRRRQAKGRAASLADAT